MKVGLVSCRFALSYGKSGESCLSFTATGKITDVEMGRKGHPASRSGAKHVPRWLSLDGKCLVFAALLPMDICQNRSQIFDFCWYSSRSRSLKSSLGQGKSQGHTLLPLEPSDHTTAEPLVNQSTAVRETRGEW